MSKGVTMRNVVKKAFVVASALLLLDCVASESTNSVSEVDLCVFFKSIESEGTNFVLTTRRSFLYSVNEDTPDDRKFCKAGEKIVLSEGSELVAVDRHHTMRFSPATKRNGRKGFRILQRINYRGVGRTGLAYLVQTDETPGSSGGEKGNTASEGKRAMVKSTGAPGKEAEQKCLKGLVLHPCEEQ